MIFYFSFSVIFDFSRITITIGSNPTDKLHGRIKEASSLDVNTDKCVKLAQAYG